VGLGQIFNFFFGLFLLVSKCAKLGFALGVLGSCYGEFSESPFKNLRFFTGLDTEGNSL